MPPHVTHPILGVHLGVDPGLKRKKKVKKKQLRFCDKFRDHLGLLLMAGRPSLPVDSCGFGHVSAFRRLFSIRLTSHF